MRASGGQRGTDDGGGAVREWAGSEACSIAFFYDAYSARSFSAAAIDAASSFVSM